MPSGKAAIFESTAMSNVMLLQQFSIFSVEKATDVAAVLEIKGRACPSFLMSFGIRDSLLIQ